MDQPVMRLGLGIVALGALALAAACSGNGGSSDPSPAVTEAPRTFAAPSVDDPGASNHDGRIAVEGNHAAASQEDTVPVIELASPPVVLAAARSEEPRVRTIVLDPGHGADEDPGAARDGVVERYSNLEFAFRVRAQLEALGYRVVLTRETDGRPAGFPDPPPAGYSAARLDVQARVDTANAAAADLFLAIHSNGSTARDERGVEVWYDGLRPFADRNAHFAGLVLGNVLSELHGVGYEGGGRGIKDDACWRSRQGRCFQIFVIGPPRETRRDEVVRRGGDPSLLGFAPDQEVITAAATEMPGALVELLFVSNPGDNDWLQAEAAREAMARGLVAAITAYFATTE